MTCYHPLKARKSDKKKPNGKHTITFGDLTGNTIELPCGQCIGCRIDKSQQWATRIYHESTQYESNCFLTLTYNEDNLPELGGVNKKHFQLFMKKLRKSLSPKKIRFFHCGEYGDRNGRPHYHAIIFNHEFPDQELVSDEGGQFLYASQILEDLWGFGFCWIGDVTLESAAYVARYILKKVNGEKAMTHYFNCDDYTGEIFDYRRPEYITMSNRPGIGKIWLDKYQSDVYPSDQVIIRGKKMKTPAYYDYLLEQTKPEQLEALKIQRQLDAQSQSENNTDKRLKVREKSLQLKINKFKRPL